MFDIMSGSSPIDQLFAVGRKIKILNAAVEFFSFDSIHHHACGPFVCSDLFRKDVSTSLTVRAKKKRTFEAVPRDFLAIEDNRKPSLVPNFVNIVPAVGTEGNCRRTAPAQG